MYFLEPEEMYFWEKAFHHLVLAVCKLPEPGVVTSLAAFLVPFQWHYYTDGDGLLLTGKVWQQRGLKLVQQALLGLAWGSRTNSRHHKTRRYAPVSHQTETFLVFMFLLFCFLLYFTFHVASKFTKKKTKKLYKLMVKLDHNFHTVHWVLLVKEG